MEHIEETLDLIKTSFENNMSTKIFAINEDNSDLTLEEIKGYAIYPENIIENMPYIEIIPNQTYTELAGGADDFAWDDDEHNIMIIIHNVSRYGESEDCSKRSYRIVNAISDLINNERTLNGYILGGENDYATGTDQNLDNPDDDYNCQAQFNPIAHLGGSSRIYLGSTTRGHRWNNAAGGVGNGVTYSRQFIGIEYGQAFFRPLVGNWAQFAADTFNGEQTFYFPNWYGSTNGGYITYWYNKTAWETAFNGNNSHVVIATDGSVYKGSISNENLVVNKDGKIGKAGGATFTNEVISWWRNTIDYKPMYADGTVYKQEVHINGIVKRVE